MAGSGATQIAVLSQGRAAVYEEPTGPAGIRVRELPRTEPPRGSVSGAIRAASINQLALFSPKALSWEEAGAFPLTFLTAWRMLTTRARLQAGEKVLIVGAGGGVAVAAAAIAKHLGAKVFVTSRSEAKRRRALELGAEAAFESTDFSKAVRDATDGGADVVVEHVGPATLSESMRSVVMGGRIVTCGSTTGVKAEITMP